MSVTNKIKILECIRQGQVGGGESHLLSLVENLDRSKFEAIVLSFTDGPMVDRLVQSGVESHVIYTEKPFDITVWGKVKRLLKEKKINLVHAHGTRAGSNIIWAARSLGIPVVYTVHGWSFHPDQNYFVRKIRISSEKYLTSRADVNISVSASNKQSGKEFIRNFESIIIYNGIDQHKFSPLRVSKEIRSELGIPADTLLVLFIARFTVQKQPLTLIKAFSKAVSDLTGMHLLMIGDGDMKKQAVELANTMGISTKVTFQSFRQDVPDLLAAADIFVLPSLWEGLPIGLLEAMAMGKAVIATNVDGTREVVVDTENGLLIKAGNIAELTEALLRLGKDAILRKKIRKKALETVQQKFSAADMTRQIETVYENVLRKGSLKTTPHGI